MASLLVSVRSAEEARAALQGGASVIDVKEPERGPLGRADFSVWEEVRRAVPSGTPVSVALGELNEWCPLDRPAVPPEPPSQGTLPSRFRGFCFRKVGLAGAGDRWSEAWDRVRSYMGVGPSWVAVIYADWERADAPAPGRVLDVALKTEDCAGVLIDTWDKSKPSPIDLTWREWVDRARSSGLLTAVAGGLDAAAIERLAPLRPDIFAVRSAACYGGDRLAGVDPFRVSQLARAAAYV
ncbi:MAG: (5-formylfuran-3-yl)methyl phosphate synthase [Isosphaeraceae bacterium]